MERADIKWCAIGGVAVNHWAEEPMVTQDVDFVVAAADVDKAVSLLSDAGFSADRFRWSVNFKGQSKVSIQLSTEEVYLSFPDRSVAADVHGILLRVASLEDTLTGKILAWRDFTHRQSKRIKDFADIARLVESHPVLWSLLPESLQSEIEKPE
ncbi:nucleotidyl transferase AbiEii/AbiGii toxin family protein [Phragmitibacter flavus]|uniref:nucleotidyl transferase AbiEii/AbiGii toxin family protein n=1 Tax=Phragmitibacter flavus TaxID=2576071 RepID=UPI00140D9A84|nr:nucleotidyl transferase AbiEii/AbiGii toxin family protein [Phragmitibacter flavus]